MGCGGSKSDTTTSQARGRAAAKKQGGGGGGNQGKQQGKQGQGKGQGQGRGGGGKGGKGGSQNRGNSGTKKNTGPITEKGYKKRIRENLRDASAGNDIEYLEKCMEVFQNNHLEDGGDYEEAERRLEYLLLKKEIRDACMRNHPVVLEKAIEKVKASPYQRQLKAYLDRANYLKQHQDELDTFRHDISDLDQACVSEVRSYKYPPVGVHETMVATYLVLGHKENSLLDWSEVAALMGHYGKDNLVREVANADPKSVSNETALRARHYLSRYSLDEIRAVSNGAAAFHVWASKMAGYDGKNKGGSSGGGGANQTKPLTNSSTNKSQANKSPSKPATPGQANKTDNKNSAAGKDKGKEKKDEKQQVNTAKQQNTNPKPNTNTATKDSKTNTNTTTKNNNNTANTAKNTQNKPAPTNTANAKQTTANAKQTTSKKG